MPHTPLHRPTKFTRKKPSTPPKIQVPSGPSDPYGGEIPKTPYRYEPPPQQSLSGDPSTGFILKPPITPGGREDRFTPQRRVDYWWEPIVDPDSPVGQIITGEAITSAGEWIGDRVQDLEDFGQSIIDWSGVDIPQGVQDVVQDVGTDILSINPVTGESILPGYGEIVYSTVEEAEAAIATENAIKTSVESGNILWNFMLQNSVSKNIAMAPLEGKTEGGEKYFVEATEPAEGYVEVQVTNPYTGEEETRYLKVDSIQEYEELLAAQQDAQKVLGDVTTGDLPSPLVDAPTVDAPVNAAGFEDTLLVIDELSGEAVTITYGELGGMINVLNDLTPLPEENWSERPFSEIYNAHRSLSLKLQRETGIQLASPRGTSVDPMGTGDWGEPDTTPDATGQVGQIEGAYEEHGTAKGDKTVNPIDRETYTTPEDEARFEREGTEATDLQKAGYIIRSIFGMGGGDAVETAETKRLDPYGGSQAAFGDAFEEHGWSTDDWGGNAPGEIELNPPYPPRTDLATFPENFAMIYGGPAILEWAYNIFRDYYGVEADQKILDQKNAGWAYHNYSAEELAAGGRGPAPASPITAPPDTPATDNVYNDGNQSAAAADWGKFETGDFRGMIKMGTDEFAGLEGEAPLWWEPYLPENVNPDSIHIGVMNALMPFLSQANRQGTGWLLATALGPGGGLDKYLALTDPDGQETWDELLYNGEQWSQIHGTLTNLRQYFKGELGPGVQADNMIYLDWLINAVELAWHTFELGRPSRREMQNFKFQLDTIIFPGAQESGNPEHPNWAEGYGPILKMLIEPFAAHLESPYKGL